MNNQHVARGLFLVAFSVLFGAWSLRYHVGGFSHAGPGLFPLMVAGILLLIGVITLVRARFVAAVPMQFNVRNVGIVIVSLIGFSLISQYINMSVGIVFMVFCSTLAGTSYSVVRNIKVCVGLLAIAFAMSKLLGVNLPLI